jgi:hypothetical protein
MNLKSTFDPEGRIIGSVSSFVSNAVSDQAFHLELVAGYWNRLVSLL